ncbi:signal peptidase II [Thalassoglobus sp. JC818]|uniref:signal peptidase II n=1 Tax=Thalassoglobus sp. JC818 TaxID=3232136 RepID=UPI003457A60D
MQETNSEVMSHKSRWIWFSILTVVIVAIDQWSKVYAIENWKGLPPRTFFNDLFRIQYAENPGAFLSLFAGFSPELRFWLLIVMTGAMMFGMTVYLLFSRTVSKLVFFAFTLVVAGGVSNMIDRIRFECVIDYFNLGIGSVRTGIFNIADMAISAGFLLMLPLILFGEKSSPSKEPTESSSDATATGSTAS